MNLYAYFEAGYRVSALVVGKLRHTSTTKVHAALEEAAAPQQAAIHVAEVGDTLWRVAERHGVSPYALLAANPQWLAAEGLQAGQSLRLPARRGGVVMAPAH